MDLRLAEEHEMIRKMPRDFAEKEVAPIAARDGREGGGAVREHQEDGGAGVPGPNCV